VALHKLVQEEMLQHQLYQGSKGTFDMLLSVL
jgi:hypothetical protein